MTLHDFCGFHIQTKKLQSNVGNLIFSEPIFVQIWKWHTHWMCVCVDGMNFYGKILSENVIYYLDRYLYYF